MVLRVDVFQVNFLVLNGILAILIAYVDASYLTHDDAKSHSGMCYSLGENSTACFFSKSAKQKLVTRSSAEAELYALDISVCDVQWFRKVLQFLDNTQTEPTIIHEDNMSAMTLATHETKPKDCSASSSNFSPKCFGFFGFRQDRRTDAISMFWAFLVLKN